MTDETEKLFIEYWEQNRDHQKKITTQLKYGIPVGLMFSLPVVIILITARFWFKRADMVANATLNPLVIGISVLLISAFVAVFYKRHQWDMKEQQYLEFKARRKNSEAGDTAMMHHKGQ
jgi:hypothetical protein